MRQQECSRARVRRMQVESKIITRGARFLLMSLSVGTEEYRKPNTLVTPKKAGESAPKQTQTWW